jgi:hypothetical protein
MNESNKQFSFTRAASSPGRRAQNQFPASKTNPFPVIITIALVGFLSFTSSAQLYSDTFDTDTSANYIISKDTDSSATFAYNYSVLGIPSAPHSTGGTTKGLRLEANNGDLTGAIAGISLSPIGKSFTLDYHFRFDMWINANGPFPMGGTGSSQFVTAGVGTAGTSVHKPSGTADGTWFAVGGDGQSGTDYRAYLGITSQAPASGCFAAGTAATARNASDPYYASKFPGHSPPALQQANYAAQTGALIDGAVGFGWHVVDIAKSGTSVTWSIDGYAIATVTDAAINGDNLTIGYLDPFPSFSDNPALSFGLIDNLQVIPEPTPIALSGLGAGALLLLRRRGSLS